MKKFTDFRYIHTDNSRYIYIFGGIPPNSKDLLNISDISIC